MHASGTEAVILGCVERLRLNVSARLSSDLKKKKEEIVALGHDRIGIFAAVM